MNATMPAPPLNPSIDKVDTAYLETLVGYNARRTALAVIEVFLQRMSAHEMRPVDFSVASLIARNPGITSRQLCSTLGILPPNLVAIVNRLENRGLIVRRPHPNDGRAMGLHPTPEGQKTMREAEKTASRLEEEVTAALTAAERKTLMCLLQKVYKKPDANRATPANETPDGAA